MTSIRVTEERLRVEVSSGHRVVHVDVKRFEYAEPEHWQIEPDIPAGVWAQSLRDHRKWRFTSRQEALDMAQRLAFALLHHRLSYDGADDALVANLEAMVGGDPYAEPGAGTPTENGEPR